MEIAAAVSPCEFLQLGNPFDNPTGKVLEDTAYYNRITGIFN